jgi:hypothetical protein
MREVNGKPGQRLLTGSERAWMAGYGRKNVIFYSGYS